MEFDLDNAVEALLPWDLTLTIDGVDRVTRRPSMLELAQLIRLQELNDDEAWMLLGGLFEPAMAPRQFCRIGTARITAFIAAYMSYFRSRALKNPLAIADQVLSAIASEKLRTSKSSSSTQSAASSSSASEVSKTRSTCPPTSPSDCSMSGQGSLAEAIVSVREAMSQSGN